MVHARARHRTARLRPDRRLRRRHPCRLRDPGPDSGADRRNCRRADRSGKPAPCHQDRHRRRHRGRQSIRRSPPTPGTECAYACGRETSGHRGEAGRRRHCGLHVGRRRRTRAAGRVLRHGKLRTRRCRDDGHCSAVVGSGVRPIPRRSTAGCRCRRSADLSAPLAPVDGGGARSLARCAGRDSEHNKRPAARRADCGADSGRSAGAGRSGGAI